MHSGDIEIATARYIDERQNLIVPNVYWGLGFQYELDLMVVTQNNYAWEIEIKISKSDLKADLKKSHQHNSSRIKRLYFAVPETLKESALELIPERAGLFTVTETGYVRLEKAPKINTKARKLTDEEVNKLYKLSSMRMWTLKRHLYNLQSKRSPRTVT